MTAWSSSSSGRSTFRVAIAHDHLVQRGGAERLVATMANALPGAPIYTSVYDPAATYEAFEKLDVRPLGLNRSRFFRRDHRRVLLTLPVTFPRVVVDADVLLCSSAGWAHSVRTTGRKLVYWHAPNRWIHSPREALAHQQPILRMALEAGRWPLQRWDRRAAWSGDVHLANSTSVQRRLRDLYGIDAAVLPPPYMLGHGPEKPLDGIDPGFLLLVSRLRPYKNVEAVVEAFASLPSERLVVIGDGAQRAPIAATAPDNVSFIGAVSDEQLRWAYRHAAALVAPAIEDFGLTPVEAAAFGTPTAALNGGGYVDTVVNDRTGVFFDRAGPQQIAEAVRRVVAHSWDSVELIEHADRFSLARFECELSGYVSRLVP